MAGELDLSGSVRCSNADRVDIVACGRDQAVAALLRLALQGSKGSWPEIIHTEPNAPIPEPGFLLLEDA